MLENFQLAGLVGQGDDVHVYKIPLHQALQVELADAWHAQLNVFANDVEEVDFDPGYTPEEHERFRLTDFALPAPLVEMPSQAVHQLDSLSENEANLEQIRAIVGVAESDGRDVILFQSFSRSHVIRPGRFLLLRGDTYETVQRPAITLDGRLSAVYWPVEQKLLFHNFRTVNTFLPLADIYREASEADIRSVLGHESLAPEDVEALAVGANQWFRRRFALLRDSGILDTYSPKQLQSRSKRYGLEIKIRKGRIVFPADRGGSKRLLQFLNEEIFRGAVTENLYETNSKRKALP